jgi:hypothetical protein
MGNREVLRIALLGLRAHLRDAPAETCFEEEGGSWGRHGFPCEPKAEEAA